VRPGDPAFFREVRAAYRIGGEDVRRETVGLTVVTGATAELEKPLGGPAQTFLQLSARASHQSHNVRREQPAGAAGDPVFSLGGTANTKVIRDQFLVFPSLQPFARAGLAQPRRIRRTTPFIRRRASTCTPRSTRSRSTACGCATSPTAEGMARASRCPAPSSGGSPSGSRSTTASCFAATPTT